MALKIPDPENPGKFFEIPAHSTELFDRAGEFAKIFGEDLFFVAVRADLPSGERWQGQGEALVYGDDTVATLAEKVVIHPKILSTYPEDIAWRAANPAAAALHAFLTDDANKAIRANYPTFGEVRKGEGAGKDVYLYSSGGMVFAHDGLDTRILLSQRSAFGNVGRWQDPSGLVSGPSHGAREIIEELGLVSTQPKSHGNGDFSSYLVPVPYGMTDAEAFQIKMAQGEALDACCTARGLRKPDGTFLQMPMEALDTASLGLPVSHFVLRGADGEVRERFEGFVGYEEANPYLHHPHRSADALSAVGTGYWP